MSLNWSILCQDSVLWLKSQPDQSISNVITGIPDLNELGPDTDKKKYLEFFNEVSQLIFKKLQPDGYAIFVQTDRKYDGALIDKSYLLTDSAYKCGLKLVWHKMVCQRDVGKKDLYRPTYSHFLCYTLKGSPGTAFEDVFPVGGKLYENGTPFNVALSAADFISKKIKKQKHQTLYQVVDPFVGRGTVGLSCVQKGLTFLGIDIDKNQCQSSEELLTRGSVTQDKVL
jgi:hypothetical protein